MSPFALRFTQEHIRTTFRDGRSVEAAVAEIKESPGSGDYDVILRFPFPAIEIVRWHVPHHHCDSPDPEYGVDGDHWFTLDNRRLYCLQRAAAACWPRRAAVAVEILYASRGSVKRKCDTTTHGCSVTIAPSIKDEPVSRWDWREEVQCNSASMDGAMSPAVRSALASIELDDAKLTVDALSDLPSDGPTSAVARALEMLAIEAAGSVKPVPIGSTHRSPTPSTVVPSDESDTGSRETTPREHRIEKPAHPRGRGDRSRGATQEDVVNSPDEHWDDASDFAWWAVEEINDQLNTPGNNGYVWISHWNNVYAPYLGQLRTFLESHPDKFAVISGKGRGYRVAPVLLTSHEASKKSSGRHKARTW